MGSHATLTLRGPTALAFKADLVWFNETTRQVYIQLVNGFGFVSQGFVYTLGAGAWRLAETADFDGDGKADLLWYNTTTGQVWMVLMNGLVKGAEQQVFQEPDLNWGIFNR